MAAAGKTIEQSAALPYRIAKEGPRILLITSRETRRWVIPKGNVEESMTPAESAALEAFEEAGVRGKVSTRRIGVYFYPKSDIEGGATCRVEVYPMAVSKEKDDWPERSERTREWVSVEEGAERVFEKKLRKLILKLPDVIDPG